MRIFPNDIHFYFNYFNWYFRFTFHSVCVCLLLLFFCHVDFFFCISFDSLVTVVSSFLCWRGEEFLQPAFIWNVDDIIEINALKISHEFQNAWINLLFFDMFILFFCFFAVFLCLWWHAQWNWNEYWLSIDYKSEINEDKI